MSKTGRVNARHTQGPGKHGHCRGGQQLKEYSIWNAMIQRCYNPNCREYAYYGARGIRVCGRWLEAQGFAHFLNDLGRQPHPRASIHRVDNDGNYEPGNVVWADARTQARHTRGNRVLTFEGQSKILVEWAEELGIRPGTLAQRLFKGMSVGEALTAPVLPRMPSSLWRRNPNARKRGPKPLPRDENGRIVRPATDGKGRRS